MTRVLLQKELRQHWPWLILLGGLVWIVALVVAFYMRSDGGGAGSFNSIGIALWILMPVVGLILGHLFVSVEYRNKSQLFLEGLPLAPWRMISLKLTMVMLLTIIYVTVSILIGWAFAGGTESVTPRFMGIMIASACGWGLFMSGFFFTVSFMGRYRIAIYMVIIVALFVIHFVSSIPLGEFPPYALINRDRFGLERDVWPFFDLKVTGICILGWIAAAFVLGLSREGSVASLLGEKMSYREKMVIGGGIVGLILSLLLAFGQPKPEPFDIPDAVAEDWQGVKVFVSPEEQGNPVDEEIAIGSKLARRLAKERDWLGIPAEDFPKVYLIEKSDIEEWERISWEDVEERKVILMYAGYRQEKFSENRLLSWTLSQILVKHSSDRVQREKRWWIVCGLEGLWEMAEATPEEIEERIKMAVVAVKEQGLTVDQVIGWSKYQDDAEWRSADAVAWMGLKYLQETKGRETVQKLAHATVTKAFERADGRAVLWDLMNPVKPAFEKSVGMSLESFVPEWKDYILSHDKEDSAKEEEG